MEVTVDLPNLLSQSNRSPDTSASRDSLDNGAIESSPETPKPIPMAFTIDFGAGKSIDKSRLEHLAKQSQARHQRVQSMSASLQRTSPTAVTPQKPPMSAKLPRKAQGYNSEGYFSSDQEDSLLSGSVKLRQSPLAQNNDFKPLSFATSPVFDKTRRLQSPIQKSKSPIVDSIMSRSDTVVSRQGLNLPLKNTITGSYHDIHSPYSLTSYNTRQLNSILDQSPDGMMLTDISSPELDVMTPDNGLSSHEHSPKRDVPDLFKKCVPKNELEILEDIDRHSNSSTGTYTIEADYTEEQKARMSIDRTFGVDLLKGSLTDALARRSISKERDPELILDIKEPLSPVKLFDIPKVSTDRNVLEINCTHEPADSLASQTSKQIKSTRNYLEKIKSRVRTISEKTFQKTPSKPSTPHDEGSFTLVTSSGILAKPDPIKPRRSLSRSQIDKTDYVHRLSRESSVPVSLPTDREEPAFESTVLRNAQTKLRDDSGIADSPDQIVGKLSYLSLNRCKGDQTWIQDWAESVKKYNNDTLAKDMGAGERPPVSPRHQNKSTLPLRALTSSSVSKIPSPVSSAYHSPRAAQDSSPDTASYLLKTQNAITNLQAKLSKASPERNIPPLLTSSLISEKTAASRLPVSQLSRSNSLNYRLKRKDPDSPLRSPGHYVITGSVPAGTKLLLAGASRSLDADDQTPKHKRDWNMNSPTSERTNSSEDKTLSNRTDRKHARHRSFDGRNAGDYFNCDNAISLKTVLRNNAFEAQHCRIDPTGFQGDRAHAKVYGDGTNNESLATNIKRSSSFSQVNRNNNYIRSQIDAQDLDYSDESDYTKQPEVRYNRAMVLRRERLSPELKTLANASRCPNTPELARKFGPGLVRTTVRPVNKERALSRMSEPPRTGDREKVPSQGRKISDTTRQDIVNRLTKSRSSTREMQPKKLEKGTDKPNRQRSASSLARELEYSNWKKRSSYDPMAAARGSRSGISPCHSSPVHRSQSFHSTNLADLEALDYSSEDEQGLIGSPIMDSAMITSTHSEILRPNLKHSYHVTQPSRPHRRETEKRKTFILDNTTDNDQRQTDKRTTDKRTTDKRKTYIVEEDDKRKTFIVDSDTNSTTNGSSPRNSSIFSHEKASLTTGTSDTEGESGTESAPVVMRPARRANAQRAAERHSGDYSMSSSTTSIAQQAKRNVQPRYLDISKYKNDTTTAVANHAKRNDGGGKGSARRIEMEQKKAELEKWKRRASYDPRKAAAAAKTGKQTNKTASSVLRSQSFHGPVTSSGVSRYVPSLHIPEYGDDYTSDNDF